MTGERQSATAGPVLQTSTMLNKFLLASVFSVAVALPALAQQSSAPSTGDASTSSSTDGQSSSSNSAGTGTMTIREHLRQDLMKGGFTDVQVMPTSSFVRTKDKSGHRVMMMIGPDLVTTLTNAGTRTSKSKAGSDTSSSNDGSPN